MWRTVNYHPTVVTLPDPGRAGSEVTFIGAQILQTVRPILILNQAILRRTV